MAGKENVAADAVMNLFAAFFIVWTSPLLGDELLIFGANDLGLAFDVKINQQQLRNPLLAIGPLGYLNATILCRLKLDVKAFPRAIVFWRKMM